MFEQSSQGYFSTVRTYLVIYYNIYSSCGKHEVLLKYVLLVIILHFARRAFILKFYF